jgi:superfamily II DNA or RNA helicase
MNLMLFPASQHRADDVPSDADLARFIPANAIAAGRAYAQAGRVLRLTVSDDGTRIEADTQGSRRKPYSETIALRRDAQGQLRVIGLCTCAVHTNCKHVAAVLFVARGRHKLAPAPAIATPIAATPTAATPTAATPIAATPAPVKSAPVKSALDPVVRLVHQQPPPPPPRATPPPQELMPYQLANWLSELEAAQQADDEEYPPSIRQRLLYVLDANSQPGSMAALAIQPVSVQLRKTGEMGSGQSNVRPEVVRNAAPPRYLRPSDRIILRRLSRKGYSGDEDEDPQDTLRRIIATGRARWANVTGPAVHEGPPRPGRIHWTTNDDGSQRPQVSVEGEATTLMRVPEPWYAEPATGTLGPVALDIPAPLARRLLAAPVVPPEQAARVRSEIARRLPSVALPAPDELPPPEEVNEQPRPHLLLLTGNPPLAASIHRFAGASSIPLARLSFGYGPFVIRPNERRTTMARGGRLYHLLRHRDAEERVAERLEETGLERVGHVVVSWYPNPWSDDLMLTGDHDGSAWLRFLLHEVPTLRAEGWTVEIADDFPVRLAEPDGDISAALEEGSGIDWLELHLGVMVGGERLDLVPSLIAMIGASEVAGLDLAEKLNGAHGEQQFLVPLKDGRFLPLPLPRIRPILLALMELFARGGIDPEDGGRVRFTRLDAADVAALEEASGVTWQGGESLRALGRQLREAGGSIPHAAVPAAFLGTLRAYQAQGVDWLQFLRSAELGGVLADDMGLGKTVQTLAHLSVEHAEGRLDRPCLIVCPTSVVPNWAMEAARFAPSLKLLTLHGPSRKERFGQIDKSNLVITTYPLLTRDHAVLTEHEWHVVVLDEAQMIKNPNAETTRQALRLKARQRLCLSGTPLQNHLGELWSLFDFLAPGFLGSARSFRMRFRTPIEKHGDKARGEMLTKRVRPFLLRRTKEEVVLELPPKTEITEPVEMEAAQQGIYESIRLAMHAKVRQAIAEKGLARSGIIILDALLKMRQACCDPRLLKLKAVEKTKAGSAKLDRLMEMLGVMLAEGRRVLLFSQFTEMLGLIEERLAAEKVGYVLLTGDTRDRATPVKAFQSGKVPLFLISLKAGGVGLNLTAADTVIHYDPWWNPAVEDQATDRAHRIGQDKAVFVHRLVTLATIEEKMEVLKEKKRAIVASVLEAEHGGALRLTEGDVDELFGGAAG